MAGLALHTVSGLAFGTAPVFYCLTFFNDGNAPAAALPPHLKRGEYAGRAGADNDNIPLHGYDHPFAMAGLKAVFQPFL